MELFAIPFYICNNKKRKDKINSIFVRSRLKFPSSRIIGLSMGSKWLVSGCCSQLFDKICYLCDRNTENIPQHETDNVVTKLALIPSCNIAVFREFYSLACKTRGHLNCSVSIIIICHYIRKSGRFKMTVLYYIDMI